ncbi:hypothetical protein [Stenotrophomonas sp. MMGLT7]|uniref:hypothetical protein n=1 Tax=Stenotrophomonas sp. MMGLT7 TaxID=2901227 RepID=UPI001E438D3B|nr:hypothetical protein [Stenotrophomonas sp. MMGLT7]MCD7099089.1 hypothetical protein [Stenotrophomonas sp. MMGLT7]
MTKRYEPTPEQRAAMDRAKRPQVHPYRTWQGMPGEAEKAKAEQVVPFNTRLVRA